MLLRAVTISATLSLDWMTSAVQAASLQIVVPSLGSEIGVLMTGGIEAGDHANLAKSNYRRDPPIS